MENKEIFLPVYFHEVDHPNPTLFCCCCPSSVAECVLLGVHCLIGSPLLRTLAHCNTRHPEYHVLVTWHHLKSHVSHVASSEINHS